ncbi:MAG: HAD hydrolase family protein [Gallionellaceae bacterium]|jgi:3-deoxy-D-manno-octulosonate 8-phosphate phosphatase (KDO 8-P phosphatase)|nr:HAD hydrolase family protein [Gallionellaceae bacterium]
MPAKLFDRIKAVRLIAFDIDGVMTDGGLFLTDSGEEIKRFNSLDGHGLKMLRATGVIPAIITGRTSRSVELRAKNLGIEHVFQGVEHKLDALRVLLERLNLPPEAAAFMGDDVVDLPPMQHAGLALTVPDAPEIVRERAHYVTARRGGHGAVREVCELLMAAQGTLDAQLAPYLQTENA